MWVHLDAAICSAPLIGWLEGAVIGGAVEGEELIESVTEALEGSAATIKGYEGIQVVLYLAQNADAS